MPVSSQEGPAFCFLLGRLREHRALAFYTFLGLSPLFALAWSSGPPFPPSQRRQASAIQARATSTLSSLLLCLRVKQGQPIWKPAPRGRRNPSASANPPRPKHLRQMVRNTSLRKRSKNRPAKGPISPTGRSLERARRVRTRFLLFHFPSKTSP